MEQSEALSVAGASCHVATFSVQVWQPDRLTSVEFDMLFPSTDRGPALPRRLAESLRNQQR